VNCKGVGRAKEQKKERKKERTAKAQYNIETKRRRKEQGLLLEYVSTTSALLLHSAGSMSDLSSNLQPLNTPHSPLERKLAVPLLTGNLNLRQCASDIFQGSASKDRVKGNR